MQSRNAVKRHIEGDDSVVPKILLLDPRIPVVQGNIPGPHQGTIQTFQEKNLGNCRVIQVADSKHGQGYYLEVEYGKFGKCLTKYWENRNEISQQLQLFKEMGMSPEAAKNYKQCEADNNKKREITFASQLNHSHVMRILAFISPTGKRADINAIIMEGASLGTLENYAKKDQLPDLVIKMYALQLADALRYCHDELNIIHRDVRPRNIYVHGNGQIIKLGNFGYAREDDSEMKTANKGDELYYKAPEMIYMGDITYYSFPVDVYGYGMVIWSISHRGSRPFWDQNRMLCANSFTFRTYLEKSNENRPPIRENLDPLLAKIIRRCWVKEEETNGRPPMAEVVASLQQVDPTV